MLFVSSVLLTLVGAPLFGQSVSLLKLSELQSKFEGGEDVTYVVNFWATWCAPCVKELPFFEQLKEKYNGAGVEVLLVSLDARSTLDSKVRPFVSKSGLNMDFFLLDETNQQEYIDKISTSWSGALPATMIVNPGKGKRRFIEGELAMKQLEDALEEIRN